MHLHRLLLRKITELHFDNSMLARLPVDSSMSLKPRQVSGAVFSRVRPTPVTNPIVVACSSSALGLVDLQPPTTSEESKDFADFFSGNRSIPGADTAAHCYAGHQFGTFSGQLGDGRAHLLGEVITSKNERWELQLKGSGATPYARTFDGRAVLRSCIREFLCSEAMHHLNIPTTRAGCVITSDTTVVRDPLYTGDPKTERASVVLRIAQSFLRFGSFEITKTEDPRTGKAGPSPGQTELIQQLLEYVIERFFPDLHDVDMPLSAKCLSFYNDVVRSTAQLVAQWQCVGFVHGVLNTDNMSILGLTFDYGPFGFMDYYDPKHVSNTSDKEGLYCYENQPKICRWNLLKFGEALSALLPQKEAMKQFGRYDVVYEQQYISRMRKKLGLLLQAPDENKLIDQLMSTLLTTGADFTNTFRTLCDFDLFNPTSEEAVLAELVHWSASPNILAEIKQPRVSTQQLTQLLEIAKKDPEQLIRYGVDQAWIQSQVRQFAMVETIANTSPERKQAIDRKLWTAWLSNYRKALEYEGKMLTDGDPKQLQARRHQVMRSVNPRFVLRNHLAQRAIENAEQGDFTETIKLLNILQKPFEDQPEAEKEKYHEPPTDTTARVCVSCSS